jgi:NAD(P)-dependent dehydrogenase (short-subunit alcohol dehydrogenase family)
MGDKKEKLKKRSEMSPNERELEGEVVFLTGASSGIGRATTIRLAQEGANVAGVARTEEDLEETRRLVREKTGEDRMFPIKCDVTREEQVKAAFAQTVEKFSEIQIVIANAGSMRVAPIHKTSLALWEEMFAVLATGSFLTAREAFRHWLERDISGRLVFTSSKNTVAPSPGASAYASAKAAVQHLARCLADEGGPHGIRTNTVLPDAVIRGTNILSEEELRKSAEHHGVPFEDIYDYYRKRNAMNVSITPEDVAEAIFFLCSPRSQKINGAALTVDGGMSIAYLR